MTDSAHANSPDTSRVLLLVFGMGRSGSSALTRVLSLCGATLPVKLLGATDHNPLGHWEPQHALDLNEAFLAQHGSSWYDPTLRLQGEIDVDSALRDAFIQRITAFLRALPAAPVLLVKEPRITALSVFWFEAAARLGYAVRTVVPVRHPQEVAASLASRDGASPELANALWLKYNLLAERHSRPFPRVFVEYPALLRNWQVEIARISAALSIDLSVRDEAAIDAFLRPDLRHERTHGNLSEIFGRPWLSQTYTALSAASRDEHLDRRLMDEIFDAYRTCERAFRKALTDPVARCGSMSRESHVRNPHIAQLIHEVADRESVMLRACLNSAWYLGQNPDLLAAAVDPCEHWFTYGVNEGRLPSDDPLSLLQALVQERTSPPVAPTHSTPACVENGVTSP